MENTNENQMPPKAPDRLEVLKKIEQYELEGKFDVDVEQDPPTTELKPNMVDYLQKKLSSKFKRFLAYKAAGKVMNACIQNGALCIKQINGIENWKNIQSGAVITCNHFNMLDSFAMYLTHSQLKNKKRRLYRVIREGNYTNAPGGFSLIMQHCDTLPLSSNKETMVNFMRAVSTLLSKKQFILIYPEEAMWWNYRKPRPLKQGAFKIAVKNNVPVLPIFITMNDSNQMGPDGFLMQEYTVNVFPPIYPDASKSRNENIEYMMEQNAKLWKECYEQTYKTPLTFSTRNEAN